MAATTGLGDVRDALHQQLAVAGQPRRLLHRAQRDELLDVGAGDEDVGLAGAQHDGLDHVVGLEPLISGVELPADRLADLVDAHRPADRT